MKKGTLWILLAGIMAIAIIVIGCSPKKSEAPATQTQTAVEAIQTETETQSETSEFPKVMYVNSTNGLRGRAEPSTDSNIVETLLHGQRIEVTEKSSTPATIDGITDYWYKTWYGGGMWFFGGYLSGSLPSDLPVIIGTWEDADRRSYVHDFSPNKDYYMYRKESSLSSSGSWELTGNTLTIKSKVEDDSGELSASTEIFTISVIDSATLTLSEGTDIKLMLIRQ
jgi:hypothetical protein